MRLASDAARGHMKTQPPRIHALNVEEARREPSKRLPHLCPRQASCELVTTSLESQHRSQNGHFPIERTSDARAHGERAYQAEAQPGDFRPGARSLKFVLFNCADISCCD